MEIAKRIGGGILGGVEGWFIGGLFIQALNNAEKFTGSILWGIIGAAIGALIPIATVIVPVIFILLFGRREGKDD